MSSQAAKKPTGRQPAAQEAKGQVAGLDYTLLIPVLLLVGIGVAMVYSASCEIALKQYGNEYYFFKKQLIFAAIGCPVMLMLAFVPYRLYRSLTYLFLLGAVALLVAVLVSGAGQTAGGATRWLRINGLSFQPIEFAKLSLIIFMAYSLSKKQDRI